MLTKEEQVLRHEICRSRFYAETAGLPGCKYDKKPKNPVTQLQNGCISCITIVTGYVNRGNPFRAFHRGADPMANYTTEPDGGKT